MKGIYFDGKKAIFREDLPMPVPENGESLIRVRMAAVCSTDREILRGYRPDFTGVMGHEFVGVVEESPDPSLLGKTVVGELNAACGKCIYCRTGRPTHCTYRRVLGMHKKDGCFAEYMTLDAALIHQVSDGLPVERAIYTEPLAAAFEIMTQMSFSANKNIAILGDGRLAYCVVQAFVSEGYKVTVLGKHPEKLKLFEPYAEVSLEREKEAYEVVVEATGSPDGIRQAFDLVRKKGTIVLKSTYAGEVSLPLSLVAVNEITIMGSRCGPFAPALDALSSGRAQFPDITVFTPEEFEHAFAFTGFKAGFVF